MGAFFLRLLGVPGEEVGDVTGQSFGFHGGVSAGLVVFLLLLAGALAWWVYRLSPVGLSPARRRTLTVLRCAFLALVLAVLLRPVLEVSFAALVPKTLVVLVDGSGSMATEDPRVEPEDIRRAAAATGGDPASSGAGPVKVARLDLAKAMLKDSGIDILPRLDRAFELPVYTFGGGRLERLSAPASPALGAVAGGGSGGAEPAPTTGFDWVDGLAAEGGRTALGDALDEAVGRVRGRPLAGVFLVTDGAQNAGRPALETAAALGEEGVPVFVYGVGVARPRDVMVEDVIAPEVALAEDAVTAVVKVASRGLAGQPATVLLKAGGDVVAQAEIALSDGPAQEVELTFVPERPGEFDLEASVEPRADEVERENNARQVRLRVADASIRVLMVEETPRWEFRYLQAMLLREKRVLLDCVLFEADAGVSRGDGPYLERYPARREELFRYDLILFGDVERKHLTPEQLGDLAAFVARAGGSLVVVAGRASCPQDYRGTALEDLLPVTLRSGSAGASAATKPVRLTLTPAGTASPMTRLTDAESNPGLWGRLPPVYWVARSGPAKPAAEVLLVDPDPANHIGGAPMPVVVRQRYGLGQVLYVGTDNTWRWRKNVGDLYFTTFWGQVVQQLSGARLLTSSRRTQLRLERRRYRQGERVTVFARIFSPSFEPSEEPEVQGVWEAVASGRRGDLALRLQPGEPGLYRGEFLAPGDGRYQVWVAGDRAASAAFEVREPDLEREETALDEALLRQVAEASGGAFFREEDLAGLPARVDTAKERVASARELEFAFSPLYFLLILLVITAEWILRKVYQLK